MTESETDKVGEVAGLFRQYLILEKELKDPLNPVISIEQLRAYHKEKFKGLGCIFSECTRLQSGMNKKSVAYIDLVIIKENCHKLKKEVVAEVKQFENDKCIEEIIVKRLERVKKEAEKAVDENFRSKRSIRGRIDELEKSCDKACSEVRVIINHIVHTGVRSMAEQAVAETKDFVSGIVSKLRERYEES